MGTGSLSAKEASGRTQVAGEARDTQTVSLVGSVFLTAALVLVSWAMLAPARAHAWDNTVVPGHMGYNALPTLPNVDPVLPEDVLFEVGTAAQVSDLRRARDASLIPYGELVVPFRGIAAIDIEAVPAEFWRISAETQRRLGSEDRHGKTPGDMRFGARFVLFPEEGARPAAGIRFETKTTTGKGFNDRRFTDAPAYVLDALFGKDLFGSVDAPSRLRLLAKIGFMAWEQGSDGQDDAVDLGATLRLLGKTGSGIDLEWRGYFGYEQGDKPQILGITARYSMGIADWVMTVNRGLSSDAPPWEMRIGIVFHAPTPWSATAFERK